MVSGCSGGSDRRRSEVLSWGDGVTGAAVSLLSGAVACLSVFLAVETLTLWKTPWTI